MMGNDIAEERLAEKVRLETIEQCARVVDLYPPDAVPSREVLDAMIGVAAAIRALKDKP